MRSSLVHALVVGCTIVGFSGCYSGGGWHMPGAAMFGWGSTDPDPMEYADSAPLYSPAGSKTAGSSGLPAPGANSNSFSSQPASFSGPVSGRYPSTGSGSAARSAAGPYGSYADRGRGNPRDAYPSRGRYDSSSSPSSSSPSSSSPSSSKPYRAYGSNTSTTPSRGFEGKNPYVSSSPSGSSSRDGYGSSATPRYGDRETSGRGSSSYRTADQRGSGSRDTTSGSRYSTTAPRTTAPRTTTPRTTSPRESRFDSDSGSGSRTMPRRATNDSTNNNDRSDRYRDGSSSRGGQSGPYVSGANVNGYRMGTNNRIPGNTGYTPPTDRGDIVRGDSHSGGSGSRPAGNHSSHLGSSHGTGRSSASVPAEYRPFGTGSYRPTTGTTTPSYGSGTASPYTDRESETTPPVFNDSNRYGDDY